MRAFRIGYILTLSFFLVLTVMTLTFGYFSAPTGPKAPKYPSYSSTTYNSSEYEKSSKEYEAQQTKYQNEQKTFIQDKVVPYVRNVFVGWIVLFLLFQVIGLVLAKFGSALVGAAYSFSGLWAILFGPLSGFIWFVGSIVASIVTSFSSQAESEFTVKPIFQAVGLTCLLGVIALTVLGILFYGRVKTMISGSGSGELATVVDPPITSSPVSSPAVPPTDPKVILPDSSPLAPPKSPLEPTPNLAP